MQKSLKTALDMAFDEIFKDFKLRQVVLYELLAVFVVYCRQGRKIYSCVYDHEIRILN